MFARTRQEHSKEKDEEIQPTVEYKNNGSLSRLKNTRWRYLVGTRELNLKCDTRGSENFESNRKNSSAFLHDRNWTKHNYYDAISESKRLKYFGIHQGTCKQVSNWHHLPRSLLNGFSCIFNDPDCTSCSTSPKHFRNHVIMSLHHNFTRKSSLFVIPGCAFRGCCSRSAKTAPTVCDANVEHRLSSYLNKAFIYSHEAQLSR